MEVGMRAKFTQLPNSVALEYDNIYGVRIRREFFDLLKQIRTEWKKFRSNQ